MDDLISRQAAVDALAKQMPKSYTPDGSHPADEEIFMAQEIYADCIKALEILPSAQPEQRWIPVTERLPVEGESVLLCNSYGDMTLGRLVRTNEGCNWDIYAWWCDIYDWVAWMPLPEPTRLERD